MGFKEWNGVTLSGQKESITTSASWNMERHEAWAKDIAVVKAGAVPWPN